MTTPGMGAGHLSSHDYLQERRLESWDAVRAGDAAAAEAWMRERYPDHRVERFLTMFSIPPYFPDRAP